MPDCAFSNKQKHSTTSVHTQFKIIRLKYYEQPKKVIEQVITDASHCSHKDFFIINGQSPV